MTMSKIIIVIVITTAIVMMGTKRANSESLDLDVKARAGGVVRSKLASTDGKSRLIWVAVKEFNFNCHNMDIR